MHGRLRTGITGGSALLAGALLAIAAAQDTRAPRKQPHAASGKLPVTTAASPKRDPFRASVRPFVAKYCLGCHSSSIKAGHLDLQRFTGSAQVRKDPKPWQGVIDHLDVGDMPPRGSPQPTAAEKRKITAWARDFLAGLARTEAGDPGNVPLRRLSNTEYDCSIRDLTGVDLRPAREFPADGAAGEGFTNAAESLTDISPALFTKYMTAAKEISEHAYLLPGGFRFAPTKTRRDWSDEATGRIRGFYHRFAGPDGRFDFKPYVAVTVRRRDDLRSGRVTTETVARSEKLNAKYLALLWKALSETDNSEPMSSLRAAWRNASEKDVDALAARIASLQGALWQTVRVGSYMRPLEKGYAESKSRQLAVDPPALPSQTVRFFAKGMALGNWVSLRLVSRDLSPGAIAGRGSVGAPGSTMVVWDNPRFESPNRPTLFLRDYAKYGSAFEVDYLAPFDSTAAYLSAAIEAANAASMNASDDIARRHNLDPELLGRWIGFLGVESYDRAAARAFPGRPVAVAPLEPLSEKLPGDGARKAINGWHARGSDLPAVITNSSGTLEHIPGDAAPHSVVVHPTPTEFVAVAWTSPVSGIVRVAAAIAHAHPACGNGVAWWLEQRRPGRASMFAEGLLPLGESAAPAEKVVHVEKGDTLMLAVDAKSGDHGCDLTRVNLKISERDGEARVWDLASDVADTVLEGNPHADRYGNRDAWSFVKGPTRPVGAGALTLIPPGSVLAEWRDAASDPQRKPIADLIAERAQRILTGAAPDENTPDGKLCAMLRSPDGPLFQGLDPSHLPPLKTGSPFGLPADRFNPTGGIYAAAGDALEVRLPAALLAGRDFVVDARLAAPAGDHAVVFQITAQPVRGGDWIEWDRKSPIVAAADGAAYRRIVEGNERFRSLFPLFLCFPNVIPNDEVVSLKMFHREDEPLKRLFLTDNETRRIDELWTEHRFISRQPVAENKYLPLFIGFVTQDQPKEMVTFFEGMKPAFQQRADSFENDEKSAIPRQLDSLVEFTSRAFRRPLTAKEKSTQRALYRDLLAKGMSHDEAFRAIVARVLVSPLFLFRVEQAPAGRAAGLVNDWELATRLSYFLWSAPPDEELRRLATSGRLHGPGVLVAQTRRMLQDPRVRSLAVEFGAQWLKVRGFDAQSEKNEQLFPMFDASLRAAIYEETILFFADLFQQNRLLLNLLDAKYTYLNETLAKHYGIPGVTGQSWRLVENVRPYGRGGVLGLATMLTKESGASRTSPVLRGNWVVETLLGERLPRPPANVPKLPEEEGNGGLTVRQQVERHSRAPECATCHIRIDGFGFALEQFDPIGRRRLKDLAGLSVDAHAKVRDGSTFEGIDGLRSYLLTKKSDVIVRLFLRRLMGYALGRSFANSDQPLLDRMMAEWRREGRIATAVEAIVTSPQFRRIRGRDFESQLQSARLNR